MLELVEKVASGANVSGTLSLPFDRRQKSRFRAVLTDGRDVGVTLPRGTVLRDGDLLRGKGGELVRVVATPEVVSSVASRDGHLLTRVAYHLGNRHVPLQVEPGRLCYLHDHVLDAMVAQLGLAIRVETAPFEPEAGAYQSHGAGHAHAHEHHHDHPHHPHDHDHDHG